jgi:hypothetical protein
MPQKGKMKMHPGERQKKSKQKTTGREKKDKKMQTQKHTPTLCVINIITRRQ